ncbi:MAG: histidine--tRNA ligase, partial [archaeon]
CGFEPMQVPVVENLETLTIKGGGGEEAIKELFTLEDQSGRKLGLRFEFTTSLARVIAGNPDLPKPIKALNMGTVYRYGNPQAMRYREFTQGDCDIIGVKDVTAEAELLALGIDVLNELNMKEFYFRLNDRRITNAMLLACDIREEKTKEAMRSLDKLDKIGMEGVEKELRAKNISTTILSYLEKTLPQIKKELEKKNLDLSGVEALEKIMETLKGQKKDSFLKFDPSLVRGLEYYTGPVWEIYGGVSVSVGSGGRYDNLIKSLGGPDVPAVGISFGVDRLLDVLLETYTDPSVDVFVIPIGPTFNEAQNLTSALRDEGLRVEIDLMGRGIGKNLNYANAKQIPIVLFLGEDELKAKKTKLRDMVSGTEKMIALNPATAVAKEINAILAKK